MILKIYIYIIRLKNLCLDLKIIEIIIELVPRVFVYLINLIKYIWCLIIKFFEGLTLTWKCQIFTKCF